MFLKSIKDFSSVILKLKSQEQDDDASSIINQFPFRLSISSTHVNIIQQLN